MRILNWNIQHGGGDRTPQILDFIKSCEPDIAILTEYRIGTTGDTISSELKKHGLLYQIFPPTAQTNKNTVLIASKSKLNSLEIAVPINLTGHVACASVNGLGIIATFCATRDIGKSFLTCLNDISLQDHDTLLATGDFYFGPQGSNKKAGQIVNSTLEPDWTDLWTMEHKKIFWSYQNSRGGVSQPDCAWVTSNIAKRFSNVCFLEPPLSKGLSDHAPMLFDYF